MTYAIHDIFRTLQGEGANMGRAAVFVRFSGCNLWSGREQDRASATCTFCDTDFSMRARLSADQLVDRIRKLAPGGLVVFTGGEPALQLDQALIDRLHGELGYEVAVETNGTIPLPKVQWVCVSPKGGTDILVRDADELKLVYPQDGLTPDDALAAVSAPFHWLSPMDGPDWHRNVRTAVDHVKRDSRWRLNIQAHKFWGIA